jgi:hypothetical protein
VLVALRLTVMLRLEGRARTLSGPSPELSPARIPAPSARCDPDPAPSQALTVSSRPEDNPGPLGHGVVAARGGVIAMRRVGVIVALGALLGMLGGVVTASPALARGPKWQFVDEPPTFVVDSQFCGFEIQGTHQGKEFFKTLQASDGSTITLITGMSSITLTNPANGKTIAANTGGPAKEIDFPDGSFTFVEKGHEPMVLAPADAQRLGLPGFFVSAGALTFSFDSAGNLTSFSLDGHVLVDVCAALN